MQAVLQGVGGSAWGGSAPTVELNEANKLLCKGCRTGEIQSVIKALKDGANPSVRFRSALSEITPIFLCASKGHCDIAKLLIENKQNVIIDRMGFDGATCLHHAAENNQAEMCQLLIASGCSVNQKDKLGRTPLMEAAEIGSVKVINVLINNEADLNIEDKERCSALSYCLDSISRDQPIFFEASFALVNKGANANYSGKHTQRTILHYVAAQGKLDLVKDLIEEKKVYKTPKDDENKTPLDYAIQHEHTEVVAYLQQAVTGKQSWFSIKKWTKASNGKSNKNVRHSQKTLLK